MYERELRALKESIDKWERVVVGHMERGVTDCPLCREFYISTSQKCDLNCPIKRKTNRDVCRGTPYGQWILSFRNLETHEGRSISTSRFKEESLVAAKAELQFLKDLYIEWLEKAKKEEQDTDQEVRQHIDKILGAICERKLKEIKEIPTQEPTTITDNSSSPISTYPTEPKPEWTEWTEWKKIPDENIIFRGGSFIDKASSLIFANSSAAPWEKLIRHNFYTSEFKYENYHFWIRRRT